MNQWIEDVRRFHELTQTPNLSYPRLPADRKKLRINLIKEEVKETITAIKENNIVEVADGLVDIIYVTIGAALEFGIPLEKVWDEVQRTNMDKVWDDGLIHKREDGKILKPPAWEGPKIAPILEEIT